MKSRKKPNFRQPTPLQMYLTTQEMEDHVEPPKIEPDKID